MVLRIESYKTRLISQHLHFVYVTIDYTLLHIQTESEAIVNRIKELVDHQEVLLSPDGVAEFKEIALEFEFLIPYRPFYIDLMKMMNGEEHHIVVIIFTGFVASMRGFKGSEDLR